MYIHIQVHTYSHTYTYYTHIQELLVMQVCLQVAWALEYLHGEGVLHLDVNPSNVVIRDHGGPVQQQVSTHTHTHIHTHAHTYVRGHS